MTKIIQHKVLLFTFKSIMLSISPCRNQDSNLSPTAFCLYFGCLIFRTFLSFLPTKSPDQFLLPVLAILYVLKESSLLSYACKHGTL